MSYLGKKKRKETKAQIFGVRCRPVNVKSEVRNVSLKARAPYIHVCTFAKVT